MDDGHLVMIGVVLGVFLGSALTIVLVFTSMVDKIEARANSALSSSSEFPNSSEE